MPLTDKDKQQINDLTHQFETRTGAQLVAAVVGKADDYPDIPWKAFALGAALAALAVALDEFIRPDWASIHSPVRDVAAILAAGVISAIVSSYMPGYARLFLDRGRAAGEVRQYAQGMFVQREIFATRERIGILLLVCRFEHRVFVLPDTGITRHLARGELDAVVSVMTPLLKQEKTVEAFRAGLDALADLLVRKNIRPQSQGNELPNETVVEGGHA